VKTLTCSSLFLALYEALVAQWVGDVNNEDSDGDEESSVDGSDSEDEYEYLIMKEREERDKAKKNREEGKRDWI